MHTSLPPAAQALQLSQHDNTTKVQRVKPLSVRLRWHCAGDHADSTSLQCAPNVQRATGALHGPRGQHDGVGRRCHHTSTNRQQLKHITSHNMPVKQRASLARAHMAMVQVWNYSPRSTSWQGHAFGGQPHKLEAGPMRPGCLLPPRLPAPQPRRSRAVQSWRESSCQDQARSPR